MKIKILNWNKKIELLYRASEHGFEASSFHKYCDNKGSTIVVIKSENDYIFGGFTSVPWTNTDKDKEDNHAFLFNIYPFNKKYKLTGSSKEYAVTHYPNHGPVFGGGYDIFIGSNCNNEKSSYTHSPCTYDSPPNGLSGKNDNEEFLVKDYEVYLIE